MPACDSDVIAKVTYVYTPHSVKLEFFAKSTAESTANEGSDANPNVDSTLMGSALATRGRRRQEQAQTSPRLAPLNPTDREDIRWITATDWTAGVRDDLQRTIIARLHKYNKHQAIWQARRFIQGWARGALPEGSIFENGNGNSANGSSSGGTSNRRASMGVDGEGLGFLTADGAKMSLKILVNMR